MSHDELRIKDLYPDLGKPWWRVPHLLKLNALLIAPFLTSYVGGYDGSVLDWMQTVSVWQEDLKHPKGGILGLMVTMQVIGGIACLPFAPFAADVFGRRHPVASAGRFFIGVGGSFAAVSAAPLIAELSYPTHRAIFTAVYNTSWYLGSIVAAWALVSIIQIFTIYFAPESPRWLIANDQTEEASRILSKYHAGSDEPNELVRFEVAEITAAIEFEQGNIHRFAITVLLGFIIQWCGNSLISSYLILILNNIGITNPETQNLINGGLQIYNMVVATTAACLVDRLGGRFLFLLSTNGMMFSFVTWIILSARNQQLDYEKKGLSIGVVAMVFIFYAFYNFAMNPLPIAYLVEVLPYTLRAKDQPYSTWPSSPAHCSTDSSTLSAWKPWDGGIISSLPAHLLSGVQDITMYAADWEDSGHADTEVPSKRVASSERSFWERRDLIPILSLQRGQPLD
ncbi:hypothetical protein NW755_003622 [Fusarium falciforme]|uniref:Major facilitator superfamily (MFS) profile domain-containing protein n=1 Tax=Fusarium falciforme TaxID=195108 RepID=A0A9W8RBQ8_9HYPO|nr:hypothetical protein NW755_003622 [Fusarium falciforme]